jgi:hypothetical protein
MATRITADKMLALALFLFSHAEATKAGLPDAQKAYSGSQSSSTSTQSSTLDLLWPTDAVPGLNFEELKSYEQGHNFNLRPTMHKSSTAPASDIKTLITVTITRDSTDSSTPPAMTAGPSLLDAAIPLNVDLTSYQRRKKRGSPSSMPDANGLLYCDPGMWDGVVKRAQSEGTFPLVLSNSTTSSTSASNDDKPYNPAAALLAHWIPSLRQRAAMSFGVYTVSAGQTVYTDKAAFDQAVMSWYQYQTAYICGSGSRPVFMATTTVKSVTKAPPPSKGMTRTSPNGKNNAGKFGLAPGKVDGKVAVVDKRARWEERLEWEGKEVDVEGLDWEGEELDLDVDGEGWEDEWVWDDDEDEGAMPETVPPLVGARVTVEGPAATGLA